MKSNIFSKTLIYFTKRFGLWVFALMAWFISTAYFLLFAKRVMVSIRFYKVLFPDRSWMYHLWCTWKQYHNFTNNYVDRFMLRGIDDIAYIANGKENLNKAQKKKTGGIILMSHMGNWEIASRVLKAEGFKFLLYMGIKQKEQIERMKQKNLALSGIEVIAIDQDSSSPFEIIDGVNFIKKGGFISLTGDRLWNEHQRSVEVAFLGHRAFLPEAPHLIALMSGAPLFFFFCAQEGKNKFQFYMSEPHYVKAPSRKDRKEAIRKSAQHYANLLEDHLRKYPLEWYHFEPFLKN
ncbi:MAG: lysophospholipid acyltransferase family protein [Deltaproteobacteria bacterium]|nr:lysophospholipid acyltransferase family protein [Deltaproteobacteria bacterium]